MMQSVTTGGAGKSATEWVPPLPGYDFCAESLCDSESGRHPPRA